MQCVERMEEFFLGGFLAGDELDVIDQKHVNLPVAAPKGIRRVRTDGIDHVVGELFRRDVEHAQPL